MNGERQRDFYRKVAQGGSSTRTGGSPQFRFDAETVVHRVPELLLAPVMRRGTNYSPKIRFGVENVFLNHPHPPAARHVRSGSGLCQ